ncbi:hypothetical protein BX661DRAFT_175907 [Kickxella alabastrina]|uniref:uncharacterized protein n=1 Tax=Kickxella alabastrina TaxID=61397 RepID=UPI002220F8D5|nr:uncharacterized protein BX661DRAFT_175907 [Kickxella alabastrina]KAI7834992.1 hypothetical protein BX661DRAFT_175907 [Kickxella alabastrina]KAJ1947624.1 hypothetical protein GGF37_000207 [Kickxella alabastrina]
MEFPDAGEHCALEGCRQLDYLLTACHLCKKEFCADHWQVDNHNCTDKHKAVNRIVPDCPICEQPVSLRPNESANDAVNRHLDAGCKPTTPANALPPKPECAFKRCQEKTIVRTTCKVCAKSFCLKHRFEDDHNCERRNTSAPPGMLAAAAAQAADVTKYFSRSKSEQRNGHLSAASQRTTSNRRNVPTQNKSKPKDSGCVIC